MFMADWASRHGDIAHGKLSEAEIRRLEQGVPELKYWGDDLLVPFVVRKLKGASVAWLNRRWLTERGFNVRDSTTRQRIEGWLIETFAYIIPDDDASTRLLEPHTKVVHADRYGGGNGFSVHGGSGRVATIGAFQVKGVGLTPLAGMTQDWGHSHGCAWLEEAIREAIYAEIVAAEFPFGALPVVAILDTGIRRHQQRTTSGVRALLIRPCAVRLAHLERAPLFIQTSRGEGTDQLSDVRRTRDAIRHMTSPSEAGLGDLRLSMRKLGAQIAFGQVSRLHNGGYFSSNLSIDGKLLDFGGMRALPNWAQAKVLEDAPGFGRELIEMQINIRSICFYIKKYSTYSSSENGLVDELLRELNESYVSTFENEMIRAWGAEQMPNEVKRRVIGAMAAYFKQQQSVCVDYTAGDTNSVPWIADSITQYEAAVSGALDHTVGLVLDALSRKGSIGYVADRARSGVIPDELKHHIVTARRVLGSRTALDVDRLQENVLKTMKDGCLPKPSEISALIDKVISQGRRHWPDLPECVSVLEQVHRLDCTALICQRQNMQDEELWCSFPVLGDDVIVFDRFVHVRDFSQHRGLLSTTRWTGWMPSTGPREFGKKREGTVCDIIPYIDVSYRDDLIRDPSFRIWI